jgi:hypothetical protein
MTSYRPLILVLPTTLHLVKDACYWHYDWPYRIISVRMLDAERCQVILKGRPRSDPGAYDTNHTQPSQTKKDARR